MDPEKIYRQVEARLRRLDLSSLHRGFRLFPFALYDDARAFTEGGAIDKPGSFLGNTAIMYNGAWTAVWHLTEEAPDPDILTSKIVHEMLHAFQYASGEKRWADERDALLRYRRDPFNISTRLKEAALMRECLSGDAPAAFGQLLGLRAARRARFPYEYAYEARIEQIEGTAHYVELAALERLDPVKARERWDEVLAAVNDVERSFSVRAVSYLTGAALIACLNRYTSFDTFRPGPVPFAEAALEGVEPRPMPDADPRVEACLQKKRDEILKVIEETLDKNDVALEGDHLLAAWNVYDAFREGPYAVLTHFLGYLGGTEKADTDEELFRRMKIIHGDLVVRLTEGLRFDRAWRR